MPLRVGGALLTGAPELPADSLAGQEEFTQEVLADRSLEELRQMAQESETEFTPEKREQVVWDKGLLYRSWIPKNLAETWEPSRQLVVPRKFSTANPVRRASGRARVGANKELPYSPSRSSNNLPTEETYCRNWETYCRNWLETTYCTCNTSLHWISWDTRISNPLLENVTLDPDTAHPILTLSKDQKSVRWADKQQDLPDNPERFDTWRCVLGCEEFTSGRHYWEVEGKGDWVVGVARRSMKRKGERIFNPGEGIWAVQMWGGQYRACTSSLSPLTLSEVPRKIRVYLNYEEEEVTFFDADKGTKIFTFPQASFTGERICPWLGCRTSAHTASLTWRGGHKNILSLKSKTETEQGVLMTSSGA
ncbi:uncharacterized protein LOC109280204 [Alligator mississippiensis]|uniref:uncharacterized protein LOC109280204 n=1 Tax=Alligator mississippiensis TaxID=8496 RepID=UPI002877806A|nr:uncharacterized protein LOC109280204 [Alligator mississippiensis]